jgi:hypothetical protein
MCLVDIQVWWIKRKIKGRQGHIIHYGLNQSIMVLDTALTKTAVRFQKKNCITPDDDPLCCEID